MRARFEPGRGPLQQADPRVKLAGVAALALLPFAVAGPAGLALAGAYVVLGAAVGRIGPGRLWAAVRPVVPLVLVTAAVHGLFTPGDPLWGGLVPAPTREGAATGALVGARILLVMAGASLLTLTTSPTDLTGAFSRLLSPLSRLGLPVGELAMMMAVALRFVPILGEEAARILRAQAARGADAARGGPLTRARALVPLALPLVLAVFRRADELALALEARGYRGGAFPVLRAGPQAGPGQLLALLAWLGCAAWTAWRF